MNISTSSSTYWPYTYGARSTSSTSMGNELSNELQLFQKTDKPESASLDGEAAAALFCGQMSQGVMPPMPSLASSDFGETNNQDSSLAIMNFLDKVKSGTITESDLADIQELLSQKVSDDAVSDSSVASYSMMPPPPPIQAANGSSFGNDSQLSIESFLAKVQSGSVNESDLSQMQEFLSKFQTQTDAERSITETKSIPPMPPTTQQMKMAAQAYDNYTVYQPAST